jgi:uncharacterized protein
VARDDVEIVSAAHEAFARGDVAALLAALHPAIDWDASAALLHKGRYTGHDGVREYLASLSGVWDDFKLLAEEFYGVQENMVLVHGRISGRDKGSGQEFEAGFSHVAHLLDGKVVKLQIFVERRAALRAAGIEA